MDINNPRLQQAQDLLLEVNYGKPERAMALLALVSQPCADAEIATYLQGSLNRALEFAADRGYAQLVAELIPLTDPSWNNSVALTRASECGQMECVKLLLPHSDPKAQDSHALFMAMANKHEEIARFLWPLSDIDAVIKNISQCAFGHDDHYSESRALFHVLYAEHEKETLSQNMPHAISASKKKM